MRTLLQERHRPLFANLAPDQTALVWSRVTEAWPGDLRPFKDQCPVCGEELFEICRNAGLDHARVVLSMAREIEAPGVKAIEALVGHPILPWAASVEAATALGQPARVVASPPPRDTRVVVSVAPGNPHHPGSKAHADYAKWRVGKTIDELVQCGMSKRAARRGPRRGWVVLGVSASLSG